MARGNVVNDNFYGNHTFERGSENVVCRSQADEDATGNEDPANHENSTTAQESEETTQ